MGILVIIKNLAETASRCFASGIILKHFKKFITVVLRKEGFFFMQLQTNYF